MLVYIDQYGNKSSREYDSIESKNKIVEAFHNVAKQEMRNEDYLELKYSIIDFFTNDSLVYLLERKITETFTLTGF
jgi:hypothetical protein